MKTTFTEEEIKRFFQKKRDELIGEDILSSTSVDTITVNPDIMNFVDALNRIHKISFEKGRIEGKCEMVHEFIKFFNL
jgi:hypothetical protein